VLSGEQDEEEKKESSASASSVAGDKVQLYHPVLFSLPLGMGGVLN
jgi:hypothetical protein